MHIFKFEEGKLDAVLRVNVADNTYKCNETYLTIDDGLLNSCVTRGSPYNAVVVHTETEPPPCKCTNVYMCIECIYSHVT